MKQIVDWAYYNALYCKVSEEEFEKAEPLAEKEVCSVIGPIRWAEITEETFGFIQLKDCICAVIDQMQANKFSGKGKGVSQISNDGYSESYVIQTEDQLRDELHTLIRTSLSGTGLVGAY